MADSEPRLGVVLKAFGRHLRKNPVSDEEILIALDWVDGMLYQVKYGVPRWVDVPSSDTTQITVPDTETAILASNETASVAD